MRALTTLLGICGEKQLFTKLFEALTAMSWLLLFAILSESFPNILAVRVLDFSLLPDTAKSTLLELPNITETKELMSQALRLD